MIKGNQRSQSRVSTDELRYQQDVLRTLLKWSAGITLAMGLVYLVTYWLKPALPALILSVAFLLLPLIVWWCLHLLRQGRMQEAMQVFIASATTLVALFTLFMPENLVLIGMMGIFLLIRIITFLEISKPMLLFGSVWATLYLVMVVLRDVGRFTQVDLGLLGGFFWYIVPVAILVVFALLDQIVTRYLKESLLVSESVRRDLTLSYVKLESQKEVLEKSEADLSALTAKLEQINYALQMTNEELRSFAYVVSHDIRAPLRAIHNYSDFLQEDLAETLDGDQKKYIDGLVQAAQEAEELVEGLLALSRIGRQDIQIKTINVGTFLQELIASLDLPPDVEIEWANRLPTLNTEPTLLRQIFQNLILNAIKFNHASPKRIEFGWQPAGEEGHELFVRDNGIGIAPRYQQQIFRLFERLHTSQEYEGTGIGLAIVKKAAVQLGGSVRVESTPGEGSTFFITLPKT